ITRTIPVGRTFSPDQRAVYDIVLEAQKAAEAEIRPGASWAAADAAANRVIAEGLARLGLIDSPDATYECVPPPSARLCPRFRLFSIHALGHGGGLDVPDPDVSYFGAFQSGSVFTIEPGIYVRDDVLSYLPDTPGNRAMIERLR